MSRSDMDGKMEAVWRDHSNTDFGGIIQKPPVPELGGVHEYSSVLYPTDYSGLAKPYISSRIKKIIVSDDDDYDFSGMPKPYIGSLAKQEIIVSDDDDVGITEAVQSNHYKTDCGGIKTTSAPSRSKVGLHCKAVEFVDVPPPKFYIHHINGGSGTASGETNPLEYPTVHDNPSHSSLGSTGTVPINKLDNFGISLVGKKFKAVNPTAYKVGKSEDLDNHDAEYATKTTDGSDQAPSLSALKRSHSI